MQDLGVFHLLILILSPSFFDCSNRLCLISSLHVVVGVLKKIYWVGGSFTERFAVRLHSVQRGEEEEEEVADCENFEGVVGGVCVWNSSRGLWCGEQVRSMEEV